MDSIRTFCDSQDRRGDRDRYDDRDRYNRYNDRDSKQYDSKQYNSDRDSKQYDRDSKQYDKYNSDNDRDNKQYNKNDKYNRDTICNNRQEMRPFCDDRSDCKEYTNCRRPFCDDTSFYANNPLTNAYVSDADYAAGNRTGGPFSACHAPSTYIIRRQSRCLRSTANDLSFSSKCSLFRIGAADGRAGSAGACRDDFDFVKMFRESVFVKPFSDALVVLKRMTECVDEKEFCGIGL